MKMERREIGKQEPLTVMRTECHEPAGGDVWRSFRLLQSRTAVEVRAMGTKIQVLSWKQMPTQVKATGGDGNEHSMLLDDRFQQAVDVLAMQQELVGTDEYLEHWNWTDVADRSGTAQAAAEAFVKELDAEWPKQVPAMVKKALSLLS